MNTKYVILDQHGIEVPVVFPEIVAHNDLAFSLKHIGEPISAGFCIINSSGNWVCYGKSISLRLDSRPILDAEILNDRLLRLIPER